MKSTLRSTYAPPFWSATLIVAACSNSPTVPFDDAATAQEIRNMEETRQNGGVSGLPFARGAVFRRLDDYLAHLEAQGVIDLPGGGRLVPASMSAL
jgi:hypothetical protein